MDAVLEDVPVGASVPEEGAEEQQLPLAAVTDPSEVARLRALDLENIRSLVRRGQPLSDAQIRRLNEASGASAAASTPNDGAVYVANQTLLADALGLENRKTIQRWLRKEGNPGATPDNRYNVTAWKEWMLNSNLGGRRKGTDLEDLKTKSAEVSLKLQQIELDEAEGRVMKTDEVMQVLVPMLTRVVQQMRGMRHNLAPSVVGETVPEANKRIGQAVDDILTQLSIPENAKKKVFWRNVSAKLSDLLRMLLRFNMPENTSDCITETASIAT